jgi:hypothetical protein
MNTTHNKARAFFGLLLSLSLVLASFAPALAVTVGNDIINFSGVRYDYPAPGQSTWYYEVTSGSRPAISHVTWELNLDCLDVLDAGTWDGTNQDNLNSGDGSPVIGTDPTTGITGIKFDEGFAEGETRYYYFTVDGNYAQDSSVVVASKGGSDFDTANITGPSPFCEIYVPPSPAIDIEKLVNGEDADTAPGISVTEGDLVAFDFIVTNTGNVSLSNVTVTDDVLGEICGVGILGAGESFTCSVSDTAVIGLYTNVGTASGAFGATAVSDSDPANYTGAPRFIPAPAIDIEKYINGDDADVAPGVELIEGDSVTFEFVVTNTGNVALTGVNVVDDVLGAICGFGSLDVGGSGTCSVTGAAAIGLHTNVGEVTGLYEGTEVSDSDPANYTATPRFIPNPLIDIEKYINGEDADQAPGVQLIEGDALTFEFVVTNTGNVALTDVNVVDDVLGAICGFGSLGVGESGTCSRAGLLAAVGEHTNIGTVTADYNGNELSDSDPAVYTAEPRLVPAPAIDIEKLVNGEDADAPTGPVVIVGDLVTFDFLVTNTGNVDLSDVTVTDDVMGEICGFGSLAVGETGTCTVTAEAVAGQHTNIGTASGAYGGTSVSDSDPANYFGKEVFVPKPGLDLEKLVNGLDADTATGPIVPIGSTVTFTYIVTNTGNVDLANITVADDKLGIICQIALLKVGESFTCTKTSTAIAGQYTNLGKAATYYGGPPKAGGILVKDTDRGYYFGQ